jgi:hypothetical protein
MAMNWFLHKQYHVFGNPKPFDIHYLVEGKQLSAYKELSDYRVTQWFTTAITLGARMQSIQKKAHQRSLLVMHATSCFSWAGGGMTLGGTTLGH